jgi:hypothetical protein
MFCTSCASSSFLLLQDNGCTHATDSLLLLPLFGLRQQHFDFAAGQNNLKEAKHSVFRVPSSFSTSCLYSTLAMGLTASSAVVSMTFGSTSAKIAEDNSLKKCTIATDAK